MPVSPEAQHAVFLAMLARFEVKLRRLVIMDKNVFVRAAAARYAQHGTPNFFDLVDKHQQQLFATLKLHYDKVIPAFGSMSLTQIKSRSFKDAEEDDLFLRLSNEWIHTEGLKRSKLIADTSEADVLAAISTGINEGEGTSAISSRISKVTTLSPWRSDIIARTETHAAANYAGIESVRNAEDTLGVTMAKEWLPTIDSRTREDHAAMAGSSPIPLDADFLVGGETMDRPGDPSASAAQNINCRCCLGYSEAE